jgi:hypothetical protein
MKAEKIKFEKYIRFNFPGRDYYPFDPVLYENLVKLIEKKKSHKRWENITNKSWVFLSYTAGILVLLLSFTAKVLYNQGFAFWIDTFLFFIVWVGGSYLFHLHFKTKKNEFESLRTYVIQEINMRLKQREDRAHLTKFMKDSFDINLYHN